MHSELIPQMTSSPYAHPSYFVIPGWIFDAFTRRFSLAEIHEYAKLRQVASIQDVAQLEIYTNTLFNKAGLKDIEFYGLTSLISPDRSRGDSVDLPKVTEDERIEIQSTLNLLVDSESAQHEALNRLRAVDQGEQYALDCAVGFPQSNESAEQVPYRIITREDCLYIIVEEGFLSHFEGKAARLTFLAQVLKAAYAIYPLEVVNHSVWYSHYVQALRP
jgi:hypothetical protein